MQWRRIFVLALLSVALLALAGASYETLASRADIEHYPRSRHLVDAGKIRLNIYCTGQGQPTVLLEAGLADSLDSWVHVQPEIARFARVCSYDRAGYGYSDPGPMPRTSDRIASELHAALQSAGEQPPYVLVGHSFGGFNVRVFNGKYPDEVAGLILVDTTQEDQYRLLPKAWIDLSTATRLRAERQAFWAPLYIDLGIARLQFQLRGEQVPPPIILQSKYIKARTSELENIEVSAEQARAAGHVEDKPLLVLTASSTIDAGLKAFSEVDQRAFEETWMNDLQLRLAHLSTRGRRIVVQGSSHDIPTDRPDAIVSAVRELWNQLNEPR